MARPPAFWQWAACISALACGCLAIAWGSWAALRLHAQSKELQLQTVSLSGAAHIQPAALPADFTATLGPPVAEGKLLQMLDGAARRAGATINSVTFTEHPASATELGRTEWVVLLTGPYAAQRRVLQELHDRLPGLQVRRLRLQAVAGQGAAVQASLVLSLWSAPRVASAGVAR